MIALVPSDPSNPTFVQSLCNVLQTVGAIGGVALAVFQFSMTVVLDRARKRIQVEERGLQALASAIRVTEEDRDEAAMEIRAVVNSARKRFAKSQQTVELRGVRFVMSGVLVAFIITVARIWFDRQFLGQHPVYLGIQYLVLVVTLLVGMYFLAQNKMRRQLL